MMKRNDQTPLSLPPTLSVQYNPHGASYSMCVFGPRRVSATDSSHFYDSSHF